MKEFSWWPAYIYLMFAMRFGSAWHVVVPKLSRLGKEVTVPPRARGLAGSLSHSHTEFHFCSV